MLLLFYSADYLNRRELKSPSSSENILIELIEMATKFVSFSFDNIMYKQVDRISMGNSWGPLMDNVFVGFLEQQLFDKVPKQYCYVRSINDTFACFSSRDKALQFYQCLNNLHPSLSFTMEEKNNNMLPFLDVVVEKYPSSFVTSVHRKSTFTGLYISWDLSIPKPCQVPYSSGTDDLFWL